MKIIYQSEKAEKPIRFSCENCGCVFEAVYGEYKSVSQMEWIDGIEHKCECPTCHKMVYKRKREC